MAQTYPVLQEGHPVGTVQLSREGLYYRIDCSCKIADQKIYRLIVRSGDTQVRLGVLIPQGQDMALQTRIPIKKLPLDNIQFSLSPVRGDQQQAERPSSHGKFVSIYPDEPFTYLTKLKNSYLRIKNGQPCILIKE